MKILTRYISFGVVSVSLVGFGFAAQTTMQTNNLNSPMLSLHKPCKDQRQFHCGHHFMHSFAGSWMMGLQHAKQLTADQAKIVAEAAVILYGDSSMQVGTVTTVPSGDGHQNYQIQIINTSGQVLTTLKMNGSNGAIIKPFVPALKLQPVGVRH